MNVLVVRFPDGSREFRFPGRELTEGDRVWHEGQAYRVLHVVAEDGSTPIVTVEPDSDDIGDLLSSERGGLQLVPAG
jgi:hypothetical protein